MKRTVLLTLVALAFSAQGQVIQSGFEAWTGTLPDGWFGVKSNIPEAGVTQVTANAHGGDFAVQLANATTSHKRFTSEAVTVVSNTIYSVNFWVRGAGQVRVGLFDNRPGTSSGYGPYSQYVTATGEWTEVTLSVAAAVDAADAEFVFSVLSTTGPDHIQLDDVTITENGTIPAASIYDIQFTTLPNGDSPLLGQTVNTGGIVTASYADAYYIQNGSNAWSGIFVYDNFTLPAVGDSLTLTGTVAEFNNSTQLTGLTNVVVVSNGQPVPAPLGITTAEANEEALEGVLVRVTNATCTEEPGGANFGKWKANDGSGFAWIGKEIYTTDPDPTLGQIYNVTGVISYSFGLFGIQPRDASDIELLTGIEEDALAGTRIYPNPANELLTIDLPLGGVRYQLFDGVGRLATEGSITGLRKALDVSDLRNGMYTLVLTNGQARRSERFTVVR